MPSFKEDEANRLWELIKDTWLQTPSDRPSSLDVRDMRPRTEATCKYYAPQQAQHVVRFESLPPSYTHGPSSAFQLRNASRRLVMLEPYPYH
ncbi:hypothetical protein FRC09_003061 [Ceratobasidium sp. 395]|nr:hypothetical protein FRC09_003061 [Ceratobasidium sp. 395]